MPVRDAGPYLEDCLRSILEQTWQDFDFVIRDDGSVDGSTEILRHWAARDPRIRLFVGEESLGPAESANWVMRRTEATYVARMDADDIAHPDRLRRQLAVFDSCPDACLVGTLCEGIDANGHRVRPRDRWRLTRPGPFAPFRTARSWSGATPSSGQAAIAASAISGRMPTSISALPVKAHCSSCPTRYTCTAPRA
jgi:glycosyltransferase involved in cell wall biosynthesis